jgi:hypothetical protein
MLEKMKTSLEQTAKGLDEALKQSMDEVEKEWDGRKLEIVPGSALLDEVYKKFGFRYDKMRDGIAVASLLSPDKIDQELVTVITQLR